MLLRTFCFFAVLVGGGISGFSQSEPCLEPSSYVYKEVLLKDITDLQTELNSARQAIDVKAPEQTTVFVFGGKRSKVDEVPNLVEKAERHLSIVKTDYQRRYFVTDGGFRSEAALVFVVRPLKCSDHWTPLPDFGHEQVEFDGFDEGNTVVSNSGDLWSAASDKAKLICPPAARAVRACSGDTEAEVFILVDAPGKVVFAKTIGGHPLIRAAAQVNVKSWKFDPLKIGDRVMNRSGVVRIKFDAGPDITTND